MIGTKAIQMSVTKAPAYGTMLSAQEKDAIVEYLKTF